MKKILFAALTALTLSTAAQAQTEDYVYVNLKSGVSIKLELDNFADISTTATEGNKEKAIVATPQQRVVVDYSTWEKWDCYDMGTAPVIEDGVLKSSGSGWYQYFLTQKAGLKSGTMYEMTIKVKGSLEKEGSCDIVCSWGWGSGESVKATLPITNVSEEHTILIAIPTTAADEIKDIIVQTTYGGDLEWSYIKVVEHNYF